ncbi:MAG: ComF family protein [Lachnospiraceae bacterium]|nr:ComF family protein [Lachnospiraceae bacterium]
MTHRKENIILSTLLNTIFPRRCPFCDSVIKPERDICEECESDIEPLGDDVCLKCGRKLIVPTKNYCNTCEKNHFAFEQGKVCFEYEGKIKESIHRFKYNNRREYARTYGRIAAERYGAWMRRKGIDYIVPVPMYRGKKLYRGYNQAELFARSLSYYSGVPMLNCMKRTKNTRAQAELEQKDRKNNVLNAFKIDTDIVQYNQILVVDDIFTTGSTANETARVLLGAGAKEVYVLCIASGSDF